MDTILGLFGVAFWIASTIGIAAGVTYLVIRIFPGEKKLKPTPES